MEKLIQSRTTHEDGSVQYSLPWGKIKVSSNGDGLMQRILDRLWEYEQRETTLVVKNTERLTFEGNFCEISRCEGEYRMCSWCENGACDARKVWERLKAYEDIGLTPEEIIDRLVKAKVAGMFEAETEKTLDKLLEYQKVEQEQHQWISVEDRLPGCGERVLATDGSFVGEAYRTSAKSWYRHTSFPWRDLFHTVVTHWMPLPELPKEGNREAV